MWIIHPDFGFLSIVQKPNQSRDLTVRSRFRDHLEAFHGWAHDFGTPGPIQVNTGSDYAYRCVVSRDVVAKVMADAIERLDYSNFKDECHNQGQPESWLQVLAKIWHTLYMFQKNPHT